VQTPERRRLTYSQKAFAGTRFSDHIAMLNVFQQWEDARSSGPASEERFCEIKMVSMPTLRVTWEAKNQLISLITQAGFPEESMQMQNYNVSGPNDKLDVIIALMCMGFYPNVCYPSSKRKVNNVFFFFNFLSSW